jgi:hypothetical protein
VDGLSWQRRNALGCKQICAQHLRNKLFVNMDIFWDLFISAHEA